MSPSRQTRREPCGLPALGLVCALGSTTADIGSRLVAGDQSRFTWRDDLVPKVSLPFGQVLEELPTIPDSLGRFRCRNNQLALAAFEQIRGHVEGTIARFGPTRVGIVMGSSTAGVAEAEAAVRERQLSGRLSESFDLVQLEFGGLCEFLREVSGADGPGYALSTACSTGAKALVSARGLLELDLCDAVLVGAVDSLCGLTANGFWALRAVARDISNPMSRNRTGLTLGEGAALFLMTRDRQSIQLLGAGESSDAHHMSAPEPTGRGAEACMRAALGDAGMSADRIAYLNLHGTGTPHNDSMESAAVSRVFPARLPCSSTKPLVGHALGASGALEAAFCWGMLSRQEGSIIALPPHRFDGCRDEELADLELVEENARLLLAPDAALMSSAFGFGGSNCAIVLGQGEA